MKILILFSNNLLPVNLLLLKMSICSTSFAQKVQTGIYQLDYNTYTAFIHSYIPRFNKQGEDSGVKNIYQRAVLLKS